MNPKQEDEIALRDKAISIMEEEISAKNELLKFKKLRSNSWKNIIQNL